MTREHDCEICDTGFHVHREDGTYHRIDGMLVLIGSLTEARIIKRRMVAEAAEHARKTGQPPPHYDCEREVT